MDNPNELENLKKSFNMTEEQAKDFFNKKFVSYAEVFGKKQIPCNNCQGGGCSTCGGFGYWLEDTNQLTNTKL